jgi:streptogramin lyase
MGLVTVLLASLCTGSASATPAGEVTEFPTPTEKSEPASIAPGPDGNVWFTEFKGEKVARITPAGAITEFPMPTTPSRPISITSGPDGNVWFTERIGNRVGRITPAGTITEFPIPTAGSAPEGIASGPDGNLWFVERKGEKIGRITPAGAITEFPIPTAESKPYAIAAGPDGNLWFTESNADEIGRITPAGVITEFPIPTSASGPWSITPGPDGNLWFTEISKNQIGRITPAGAITEFPIPTAESNPYALAAGPDGNLWFTEISKNQIGRITPAGAITEFPIPTPASEPFGIAPGADGNLWFTESNSGKVARIGSGAPEVLASPPTVTGGNHAGTPQLCGVSWATWASLQPSASLFGFDGYSWLLDGAPVAAGQSFTPTAANVGHQLACAETVTYPVLDVTTSTTTAAVTVLAALPPQITKAHESASKWREGKKLARISRRKPPVGATFSFVLNERAPIRFSFTHRLPGRKSGHRCVAVSHANATRKSCQRTVTAGTLSFTGRSGANKVVFDGRVSRSKRLAPGSYTLNLTAANSEGTRSARVSLRFTIEP